MDPVGLGNNSTKYLIPCSASRSSEQWRWAEFALIAGILIQAAETFSLCSIKGAAARFGRGLCEGIS